MKFVSTNFVEMGRVGRGEKYMDVDAVDALSATAPRGRTVKVAHAALDNGGLLQQWLGDFTSRLDSHGMSVKALFEIGGRSGGNTIFLPFSRGMPTPLLDRFGEVYSLTVCRQGESVEARVERECIYKLYFTTGQVINQLLRETLPVPETIASPLLVAFILGIDGPHMCRSEWERALNLSDATIIHYASKFPGLTAFKREVVVLMLDPMLPALEAIKAGFDIVPLASALSQFSSSGFQRRFVGLVSFTVTDLIRRFTFPPDCSPLFKECMIKTIKIMSPKQLRGLLEFATGAALLHIETQITLLPKFFDTYKFLRWPSFPLAVASTCTNTIQIPFCRSIQIWDERNILINLQSAFDYGLSGYFEDT